MTTASDKSREVRLRHQAQRLGYRLEKDRARRPTIGHRGQYRITDDMARGRVVAGRSYELSLSDVAGILDSREATLTRRGEVTG
jgi:hypothetical protein